ncbi:hypothetical protein [Desulfosporosinus meridiei]|uniref:Uncharacterized protein n=1 Tax=Desulfosporosinus meridiei (strain ATCC BAA-275 / DSM 13257 / KCTC 12902 / NCIMB 13706 / S10) TaxID=768704 RepID=J7IQS6_DESMD|nr:hypothetical protein [Desulfosporosinus meridiei]AFQ44207.1 hypothetical protein Desmer_2272 [Desulfosporosinus meridiei DSM 13257]
MKKILFRLATILQILFIIIAYLIQTYSVKKMGVMRFVVYLNNTWEDLYPIDEILHIGVSILVIFTIITLIVFIKMIKKSSGLGKEAVSLVVFLIIITLAATIFTIGFSTEDYRSYYFISFILAIVNLIQNIKIIGYLKK